MVPFQVVGECRTSGLLFSVAAALFLVALAVIRLGWVRPPQRLRPILLAFAATCGNLFLH
jgi:hypothetical protein